MDQQRAAWDEPQAERPDASGVLLFVLCSLLLVGGFALLMLGFDLKSGALFAGGILAFTLAFLIPLTRSR